MRCIAEFSANVKTKARRIVDVVELRKVSKCKNKSRGTARYLEQVCAGTVLHPNYLQICERGDNGKFEHNAFISFFSDNAPP
jgi:hypothetical protein